MSKSFRDWSRGQALLLPLSVDDFVPADHLCRFVVALVTEELDLSSVLASYRGEKGQPPYHPAMMTALLLYSYAVGVYSSRRIAKACVERVDFMAIVALATPDFRTISEFRRRHLAALSGLFVQVLKLCEAAGLVELGHVALDGTKIKANASKHKAMSYARMETREIELKAEVARWLEAAEAADAAEDKALGADRRGDEMPDWVADKHKRLAKIAEAKAALEAAAEAEAAAEQAARAPEQAEKRRSDRKATPAPAPKAQRNFTDPESHILKTKDGYIQGYNAQAAVDATAQVIVAHKLSNNGSDQAQFAPLLDAVKGNLGRNPHEVSADAGYCSAANLRTLSRRRIKGYIATGRQHHGAKAATTKRAVKPGSLVARMSTKLKRGGHRSRYRLRKQVVEPVFGQIKQARGFRQFLLRGIEKVTAEWALICTVHNLRKLALAVT
ncbi:MAG: IS1182 family transposase [Gemmataceae bacterium]